MKREQEISEIKSDSVSNLLGSLKRVEAPGDFDFRVKSRIAQGRPADRNASLMPAWLKVAVPLVLVLFIGGYFGFRALNSPAVNVKLAEPVAQMQQIDTVPASEMPSTRPPEEPANKTLVARVDEKPLNATKAPDVNLPQKVVTRTGSSGNKSAGGGFRDAVQRIGSIKSLKKPKDIVSPIGLPAQDMLTQMGIDASYSGSWKVGNVKPNSIGERSGVRSGDVIEAINDQNLTEKTTLPSPFNGKSIRVRRDGKSFQVELKP